jgi:hypothetical protein
MEIIKITQEKHSEGINHLIIELNKIIKNNNSNIIITNGYIASTLQDSSNYKLGDVDLSQLKGQKIEKGETYSLGYFDELPLRIDPYRRWDDNRITLKKDDVIVCEIKIEDENFSLI